MALAATGDDRWVIDLDGGRVERCCIDVAVTLHVEAKDESYEVRIEGTFSIVSPGLSEMQIDPGGDPVGIAPVLSVVRAGVDRIHAYRDGRLEIGLADGTLLRVSDSADFEPWSLVGRDGARIVSVPGGELAVWQPLAK